MNRVCLLILFLFLSVFLVQASDKSKLEKINQMYKSYKQHFSKVSDINAKEAHELKQKQKVIFVDVREKKEQQISMIPEAIDKETFLKNKSQYRNAIIIPYCTIGYRSGLFCQKLSKEGYKARNLKGSILAWAHAGLKLKQQDKVTTKVHVYGKKWNLLPASHQAIW